METKVQKWGNSLGVRLPKSITQKRDIKEGTRVVLSESNNQIVIEVLKDEHPSLRDLLKEVSDSNIHSVTNWDSPKGSEVW